MYYFLVKNPLPQEYLELRFRELVKRATKIPSGMVGECPFCHEGKSSGKKKRFFAYKSGRAQCYNCHWSGSTLEFIHQISGDSVGKIIKDANETVGYNFLDIEVDNHPKNQKKQPRQPVSLPVDAINLSDKIQLEFYGSKTTVKRALAMVNYRRLLSAVNPSKALYVTLEDKHHHDRLIIPFYDEGGYMVGYQSRKIYENSDGPKYKSEFGDGIRLYGVERLDYQLPYMFVTEGPIDSMFIRNGVATAGLNPNASVEKRLKELSKDFRVIFIFDNELYPENLNKEVLKVAKARLKQGYEIFLWPRGIKQKDLNAICIAQKSSGVDIDFVLENTVNENQFLHQMLGTP